MFSFSATFAWNRDDRRIAPPTPDSRAPYDKVKRQCGSSLQATAKIAAFIKAGGIDVGLAGGVENMSMFLGIQIESCVRSHEGSSQN